MARNLDNVRHINRRAQAKHIAREREKCAPRSEDLARALANALRNHRATIIKADNGKDAIRTLLEITFASLVRRGFKAPEVDRKLAQMLMPRRMTLAEIDECIRLEAQLKGWPGTDESGVADRD